MPNAPDTQDDRDRLVEPEDRSMLKSQPGGVINPSRDGPTGGWGTGARWFLLALLIIAIIVVLFWIKPI